MLNVYVNYIYIRVYIIYTCVPRVIQGGSGRELWGEFYGKEFWEKVLGGSYGTAFVFVLCDI